MGSKKGGGARTPYEAPNTLSSAQNLRIIDAICEGEIAGFAHGNDAPFKSIYFDDTPVQNPDNSFNFKGVTGLFQVGTPDQSYIPSFDVSERTVSVSARVKKTAPIIRAVSDNTVNRLRVTVGVERNAEVKDNGDTIAATTELLIELVNHSSVQVSRAVLFNEKASGAFYHDVVFDSLPVVPFNIRVSRLTADSTTDKVANNTFFASYVEMIDAKLSYPNTALSALKIDSDQFGNNVPRRNYLLRGKLLQVPSNYDPETRQYSGSLWDGSFKRAWSNNPAWVFYDLLTNPRYSTLAYRLGVNDVDKWALYQIGKYCDELVDDGFGGKEPRYVCNAYITDQRQAADLLQDLASAFCGLSVWNGSQITVLADVHKDPVAHYSNANVVDGRFDYSGASLKSIHTAIHVQYTDKYDGYRAKVEYVADNQAIARYGLNIKQVAAFGCDSRGQAVRFGRWILETELRQQHRVSFTVGREGLKHLPYDIIQIADNDYSGAQIGGRIAAVSGNVMTLDRDVENAVGAMLYYTDAVSGSLKSVKITKQSESNRIELESSVSAQADSTWAMSGRVKTRLYRALSISENTNDGTYTITALRHDPEKYGAVDKSAVFDDAVDTLHTALPELHGANVVSDNGEIVVSWENLSVDGAILDYDIKLYRNNALYRHLPNHPTAEARFEQLPNGDYRVEIRARNARGVYAQPLVKAWRINYTITALRTTAKTLSIDLTWTLPELLTVSAHSEIWYSKTHDIQTARKLASLAYPQNTYTLTGVSVIDCFYFWVRLVDVNGHAGEFTAAVMGEVDKNPAPIIAMIQGQITESALSQDLMAQLNEQGVTAATEAVEQVVAQASQALETRLRDEHGTKINDLLIKAGNLGSQIAAVENVNKSQANQINTISIAQNKTAAALENEKTARIEADAAEAKARQALAAQLGQDIRAAISSETKARVAADKTQTEQLNAATSRLGTAESSIGSLQNTVTQLNISTSTQINNLRASVDGIRVGGRNLLRNSGRRIQNSSYLNQYELTLAPKVGDEVVCTIWGKLGSGKTAWGIFNTHGYTQIMQLEQIADGIYRGKGTWQKPLLNDVEVTPNDTHLNVYSYPRSVVAESVIERIKFELGNIGTDWTPAPEDTEVSTAVVQAELSAFKQAQASIDSAQTIEIDAAKSRLGAAESSIRTIQSTVANQNSSMSQQIQTLKSSLDGINVGARNYILNSKADVDLSESKNRRYFVYQTALDSNTSETVFSAYVKNVTHNNGGLTVALCDPSDVNNTVEQLQNVPIVNGRIVAKFKTPSHPNRTAVLVYRNTGGWSGSVTGGCVYYKAQLELGNVATDWVPSQDDMVGGRNLLRNSSVVYNDNNYLHMYPLTQAPKVGDEFVVTIWGKLGSGKTTWGIYNSFGYTELATVKLIRDGVYQGKGVWQKPMNGDAELLPNDRTLNVYAYPRSDTSTSIIHAIKMEIGSVGSDWTPAPEDADEALSNVSASVQTTQTAVTQLNGKVQSLYTVKVQAVGTRKAVAGVALGADGQTGDSQFLVMANKFALVQPNTTTIKAPFVVTTVNNKAQLALSGDMIVDGIIQGRHIAASQTINAPNINGGSLNIGNGRFSVNRAGTVQIKSATGNVGLQLTNDSLRVYNESGNLVVEVGKLL